MRKSPRYFGSLPAGPKKSARAVLLCVDSVQNVCVCDDSSRQINVTADPNLLSESWQLCQLDPISSQPRVGTAREARARGRGRGRG